MSSSQSNFSPDFFNTAGAVFAVFIFAKFVSHRSRRARKPDKSSNWDGPGIFHAVCVIAASIGLVLAMLITELQWDSLWADILVWIALAIAGVILLWDVIVE